MLLLLLPPPNSDMAAQLTRHSVGLVLSQLQGQQGLGMTALLYLLSRDLKHAWRKVCCLVLHQLYCYCACMI